MKSLFLGLLILLLPQSAAAQPVFNGSRFVDIFYRLEADPTLLPVEADQIQDEYILQQIWIGRGGPLAEQQSGTFTADGVGTPEAARTLGDVEVRNGTATMGGSVVAGDFVFGTSGAEPTTGYLSIQFTTVRGSVTVSDGSRFACRSSDVDTVTVTDGGYAQLIGCLVHEIATTDLALVSLEETAVEADSPDFRGAVTVGDSAISSVTGTVAGGVVEIGADTGGVEWIASESITVGEDALDTDLIVDDSTIESGAAYVGADGGSTDLFLRDAATWHAIDLFDLQGSEVTAFVESASRIASDGDLRVGDAELTVRSNVAMDSRVDVAGDFELGRDGANAAVGGMLEIQDGGVVDVDGTLTIHPLATLNLSGGMLRVGALDNQGVLNERGGRLVIPEPGLQAVAAGCALALLRRRR